MNKKIYIALLSAVVAGGLAGSLLVSKTETISASAVDYFLKIEGVAGESTNANHKGEIEVLSWSFGASNTSVNNGGGGLGSGVGKVSRKGLTITKTTDKASALLFSALASGKRMPSATFTLPIMGSTQTITLRMNDVTVSSYSLSGSQGDNPVETVSFNYSKIEWK